MKKLKDILSAGENLHQAFFENCDDSLEVARTLCAFSNTEGGTLYFGIKKNGKITGVDPEQERHNILILIKEKCEKIKDINFHISQDGFKLVLEVNVLSSFHKPIHVLNFNLNEIYIRNGNLNIKANKIIQNFWKYSVNKYLKTEVLSENELEVLNFIMLNPFSSLNKIHKGISFSMDTIDFIIVRLLYCKMIQMNMFDNRCEFYVIDK